MIYGAISPLQYKIKDLDFQKKVFKPLRLFQSGLKMGKECNKELLNKCEGGNKIASLQHKCRVK